MPNATASGERSGVATARLPPLVHPPRPSPAIVRITPFGEIARTRLLSASAKKSVPSAPPAIPAGSFRRARTACPPSPEKPRAPLPAITSNRPSDSRSRIWFRAASAIKSAPSGETASELGRIGATPAPSPRACTDAGTSAMNATTMTPTVDLTTKQPIPCGLTPIGGHVRTQARASHPASAVGALRRRDRLVTVETVGRPQLLHVVIGRECRNRVRKNDPAQLRSCVDVHIGRDARRVVERATPDKPNTRAVAAEDRHLADRAAEDPLLLSAAARYVDRVRLAREELDPVGLDQQVDDERTSGLPLAVQAVTAMCKERLRPKPIANLPAGAAAFKHVGHNLLLVDRVRASGERVLEGGSVGGRPVRWKHELDR